MRPRGTFGPVGRALLDAAAAAPGTVNGLAVRACVSYAAARYTASRLVDAGVLVVIDAGRPAVLGPPAPGAAEGAAGAALVVLQRLPRSADRAAEGCLA
jgi:hypothetical protein